MSQKPIESLRHMETIVEAATFDQNYIDNERAVETVREIETFDEQYEK